MQLIKQSLNIDFLGKRKLALIISIVLITVSLASLMTRGLNLGIDFTGGTLVEIGYSQPVELQPIREALLQNQFDDAIVQHFGTARDVMIRLPSQEVPNSEVSNQVLRALANTGNPEMRRIEFVGPQVGEELRDDGGLAVVYALIGILIYVALRFEYRFALGSVVALIHDVILTVGFFSVTQAAFDLTVLAAVLAVIGYSLNDTIVVFDRIRENFRKLRKEESIAVVNISINQTLARTLMTSMTTLLVLFALFFVGGEVIHSFALALIVGVLVGTYSSIYVASATLILLNVSAVDLLPDEKEEAAVDDLP
ncbi:MAG: protein translocase subunit SecF [Gammaproteobacteria bacterium]|jgi:preprotein translocase subunit SecF|nr:protein translocase subunit SecF [Gammaproteobacteria bacterium]|tara:strand:- start:7410 stop:8339 length:930 start_codon:yes stop_codon:yes gene_type:complete